MPYPICFPWNLKSTQWSKFQLNLILDNLSRVGFNLDPYQKKPKDESVIRYTRKIVEVLINHFEDMETKGESEEVPWMILACPNARVLQTLATTIPTTMALSTQLSCFAISTRKMIELFIAQRGEAAGGFEFDTADKVVEEITETGLMVWTDLGTNTAGARKFESSFHELLVSRLQSQRKTIFMYHVPNFKKVKFGEHEASAMELYLNGIYGEGIGSVVTDNSDIIYLPASMPKKTIRNL